MLQSAGNRKKETQCRLVAIQLKEQKYILHLVQELELEWLQGLAGTQGVSVGAILVLIKITQPPEI